MSMPPEEIVSAIRLMRLPLRIDVVGAVQRRLARVRPGSGPLELAHELGDVRFAERFAPSRRGANEEGRWGCALSVFGVVEGSTPSLLGYSIHSLDELTAVPKPTGWSDDPIDWSAAQETLLLPRLERRAGLYVPFTTEVCPKVRLVDSNKAPTGKRRIPRSREADAATAEQARNPSLSRAAAYGCWLQRQLPAATIDLEAVRIMGERTVGVGGGRNFDVAGLHLNGMIRFTDPRAIALSLLRGIGRRRAYGCGLLVLA
jgi:hypothetical protein